MIQKATSATAANELRPQRSTIDSQRRDPNSLTSSYTRTWWARSTLLDLRASDTSLSSLMTALGTQRRTLARREATGSNASRPSKAFVVPDRNKIILLKGYDRTTDLSFKATKPTIG